jgi:hypothetical protein
MHPDLMANHAQAQGGATLADRLQIFSAKRKESDLLFKNSIDQHKRRTEAKKQKRRAATEEIEKDVSR